MVEAGDKGILICCSTVNFQRQLETPCTFSEKMQTVGRKVRCR